LARAIGPQQAEHFAGSDAKADALDGLDPARIGLLERNDLDRRVLWPLGCGEPPGRHEPLGCGEPPGRYEPLGCRGPPPPPPPPRRRGPPGRHAPPRRPAPPRPP